MKRVFLWVVGFALISPALAEETSYSARLKSVRERYQELSAAREDYRKTEPPLPAEQESEYLRVLGQLLLDDPVWALTQQIQADINALAEIRTRTPEERAILETLKDFLAITSAFDGRASTRREAEMFTAGLRQFMARRDAEGARTWAESR